MNCAFHAASGCSRTLLLRGRKRFAGERGQSLIEVVVATAIFAIVAGAMIILLVSSMKATTRSRQKTLAEQSASTQIEQIRNLQYSQIGNTAGNPPGTIPVTTTLSLKGLAATRTTRITYVNDPTPLSYQSYANYKKVTVTVTRSSDGAQLARDVTYIAPPVKASQSEGQIVATVTDPGDSNNIVPNVEVDIAGPNSFSASDTTDASGQATFAALTPTGSGQYYDVTVTPPAGYVTLSDTTPPASGVHFALAPSQTQASSVQIYKPATIYVQLQNFDGTTYAGAATVKVTSSRGTQSFAYAGTQLAVTTLNGEPLVPALSYTVAVSGGSFYGNSLAANVPSPPGYPTNLTSTFSFTNAQLATLKVTVQRTATTKCTGAVVSVAGGPWSLGGATNPKLTATTVAGGLATFTANVPVGAGYSITAVSATGKTGTSTTTTVAAGTTTANAITVSAC